MTSVDRIDPGRAGADDIPLRSADEQRVFETLSNINIDHRYMESLIRYLRDFHAPLSANMEGAREALFAQLQTLEGRCARNERMRGAAKLAHSPVAEDAELIEFLEHVTNYRDVRNEVLMVLSQTEKLLLERGDRGDALRRAQSNLERIGRTAGRGGAHPDFGAGLFILEKYLPQEVSVSMHDNSSMPETSAA